MTAQSQTRMFAEAAEAPQVVARQSVANAAAIASLATRLKSLDPQILFTCARGSSDHAATFAKYLFETRLKLPTLSQAPSIASIYGGPLLHMKGQPFLLISQSGKSPDLLLSAEAAKKAGALTIALVNDTSSPLAAIVDVVIPLHAGPEVSVAATKSYIATLAALSQLVATWTGDTELVVAQAMLPKILQATWDADWSHAADVFAEAGSLFTLGRGLTLGIAQEAALKFKETSGIHAEAFSLAEVAHGPMALVKRDFPVVVFPPHDRAAEGMDTILQKFAGRGATMTIAGRGPLALPGDLHPVIAPIAMVQGFYRLINAVSLARGYDPDRPPSLNKVTETR